MIHLILIDCVISKCLWILQVFHGNYDRFTVVKNKLHKPIITRYIRIRPETWQSHISLRAEFYGCKEGSR